MADEEMVCRVDENNSLTGKAHVEFQYGGLHV